LATARLADADDVVLMLDPSALREVAYDRLGDTATRRRPYVLHGSVTRQLRRSKQSREPAILPRGPLLVDHVADLLAEAALVARRLLLQFEESLGHPQQLHLAQFAIRLLVDHRRVSPRVRGRGARLRSSRRRGRSRARRGEEVVVR